MQDTHDLPDRKRLTLETLLQVERLEKPSPEFWRDFERELQEKRLKALVKPGRRERIWGWLAPKMPALVPLSAAAGFAALFLSSAWTGWNGESAMEEEISFLDTETPAEGMGIAGSGGDSGARPRFVDSRFVVDTLVPVNPEQGFRTVLAPETFTASLDGSAHYVTNAFTAGSGEPPGLAERATEIYR